MPFASEALMRVHLSAFNGGDPESLLPHYTRGSLVIQDGRLAGEGQAAIHNILRQERGPEVVAQMVDVGGQPTIVEWSGPEGHRRPTGVVHLRMVGDRVGELHVDHREATIRRVVTH